MRISTTIRLKQSGLTLVEILVALALSSFLLTAVVQIVSSNKRSVVLSEAFVQVQESARLASEVLAQELKLAGYRGCLNSTQSSQYVNRIDPLAGVYDAFWYQYGSQHLDGIDDFPATPNFDSAAQRNRMPAGDTYGGITPLEGTDVIISRGATSTNMYVGADTATSSTSLAVYGNSSDLAELEDGKVVIVSDCVTSEIFVINGTTLPSPVVGPVTLNFNQGGGSGPHNVAAVAGGTTIAYPAGSEVLILNTTAYFIAPSQVIIQDNDGDGVTDVNSLYKFSQLHDAVAQELVPFVNDMQIEYGITNDITANYILDQYVEADDAAITTPSQIQAVRVTLTVQSQSQYAAAGNPVERDYTRVIMLRNGKIGS